MCRSLYCDSKKRAHACTTLYDSFTYFTRKTKCSFIIFRSLACPSKFTCSILQSNNSYLSLIRTDRFRRSIYFFGLGINCSELIGCFVLSHSPTPFVETIRLLQIYEIERKQLLTVNDIQKSILYLRVAINGARNITRWRTHVIYTNI